MMTQKTHRYLEKAIAAHFALFNGKIIFESAADIQGIDNGGRKIIGEFKSEREHRHNYSWWSDWKSRLEHTYSEKRSTMTPANKRWLAVIDGQLRGYCRLEDDGTGYLVVEHAASIRADIIGALNFLASEGKVSGFSGPVLDRQGLGYFTIVY
jgi:hypothetical protein